MKSTIEQLQERISAHPSYDLPPGLAVGILTESSTEMFHWGRAYTGANIHIDQRTKWHIGSCAKSLTAYLISLLVEKGLLAYESTLGDLIKTCTLRRAWQHVTMSELLCHCSGLMDSPDLLADLTQNRKISGIQSRRELTRNLLSSDRYFSSGNKNFNYSNLGYCLVGAVVDELEGSFESTLSKMVLEPLALTSAGYGPPPEGARGHIFHDGHLVSIEPHWYADNHPLLSPAGRIHLTIADWIKYLRLIFSGAFHDAWCDPHQVMYTRGAFAKKSRNQYTEYFHSGSNRIWYASVSLIPEINLGIVVATNWGGGIEGTSNINHHLINEFWKDVLN